MLLPMFEQQLKHGARILSEALRDWCTENLTKAITMAEGFLIWYSCKIPSNLDLEGQAVASFQFGRFGGLVMGPAVVVGTWAGGHHLPALNLLLKEWIIDLYGSALQPQSSASYTWMFLAASSPWKWLVVRGKDRTAWRMPEPQKNPTESTLVFLLLSCLTCRPIMVVTDVCELGFLAKSWSLFSVKD